MQAAAERAFQLDPLLADAHSALGTAYAQRGQWELAERTVFELGLIENIINFNNSPDFGVHAGLTYRF